MITKYTDVPKKARNSIECQIDKLIKRYGVKSTRLVISRKFAIISDKERLEETIKIKKAELQRLEGGLKK